MSFQKQFSDSKLHNLMRKYLAFFGPDWRGKSCIFYCQISLPFWIVLGLRPGDGQKNDEEKLHHVCLFVLSLFFRSKKATKRLPKMLE